MGVIVDNLIKVYINEELKNMSSLDDEKLEQYREYLRKELRSDVTAEILEIYKSQIKEELLQELTKKELLKYKIEEWHYFIAATIVIASAIGLAANQLTNAVTVINQAIVNAGYAPLWLLPGVVFLVCAAVVGIAVYLLFREKKYTLDKEGK